jgi:uncharacterized heparinase superfamily protein
MKALVGEQFTSGAKTVNLQRNDSAEGTLIGVDHDGYRKRFGVIHERRIALSADGTSLEGEDVLKPVRQRREVEYALRFHIHPLVKVALRADGQSALLTLPNRSTWEFEAGGMALAVEETIFFASTEGLRRSEQIVVAANTGAQARIAWSIRKTANR